jgi:hypothetical protein
MRQYDNSQPVKRKRGGQPGNHNAFKHGLRSRALTITEREELEYRIMLTVAEKAVSFLRRKIDSFHVPPSPCPFVGQVANTGEEATPAVKDDFRGFVYLAQSRLKGYSRFKIHMDISTAAIFPSQMALFDSIHEMRAASANDQRIPPGSRIKQKREMNSSPASYSDTG